MDKKSKIIIFTDLDRTLLSDDNSLSKKNLQSLFSLKEENIPIVIATGRNIFSARKVISLSLPIDFLIFSSGAGIMDWQKQSVIFKNQLTGEEVRRIIEVFQEAKLDFMIQDTIPDNHIFYFWQNNKINPDFRRRLILYDGFAKPFNKNAVITNASQLIAILQSFDERKFKKVKEKLADLEVIRATSPLDHKSIWLEVLPKKVSKGNAARWLTKKSEKTITVGIGNDYNDLDLLNWVDHSFVVNNAPSELRERFNVVKSNQEDGFAEVIGKFLL